MEDLFAVAEEGKMKEMTYICLSTALMKLRQSLIEIVVVTVQKKRGELIGICLSSPFSQNHVSQPMRFKIEAVQPNSIAERCGVKKDDVLLKMNQRSFVTLHKAFAYIHRKTKIELLIERKAS